jgi:anti-anti-sigma factor
MSIQKWSDNILLLSLSREPQMGEELQTAIDIVIKAGSYDVVVDFCDVDIITSSSIAKLLKLRKVLRDSDHSMALCTVSPQTKNIFTVTGLDNVFTFVADQFSALAGFQLLAQN